MNVYNDGILQVRRVKGEVAVGGTTGTPVLIGGKSLTNTVVTWLTNNVSGFGIGAIQLFDAQFNSPDYSVNGEFNCLAGSTDDTKANAGYLKIDSNGKVIIESDVAHDAADTENGIKISARADTGDTGQAAVADGDKVDLWADEFGRLNVRTWSHIQVTLLTALDDTYDNTTSTNNSADITNNGHKTATFCYSILSANTPALMRFQLQVKNSVESTIYHNLDSSFLGRFQYEDTGTNPEINRCVVFDIPPCLIYRIVATGSGLSSSNTFTIDEAELYEGT